MLVKACRATPHLSCPSRDSEIAIFDNVCPAASALGLGGIGFLSTSYGVFSTSSASVEEV
jgi:hypothetical protein